MSDSVPVRSEASTQLSRRIAQRGLRGKWRTRFAPAPTGFMHLGHVVNALHVWGIARTHGGDVVVRIEDHDRTRARAEFDEALLEDLSWLGFVDAQTVVTRQSQRAAIYESVLGDLARRHLEYGCVCTRKDIAQRVGTQFGEESPYPGTCAGGEHKDAVARRVRTGNQIQHFDDVRLGAQTQDPSQQCGDFLVRDRNGNFTYQLCAAVDDWKQNIDLIIRGEDLLSSTGRQLQLARMIGRESPLLFLHHGLLLRPDGLKLSKSLGDTGVREMREARLTREDVLGRAAFACGLIEKEVPLSQDAIAALFTA